MHRRVTELVEPVFDNPTPINDSTVAVQNCRLAQLPQEIFWRIMECFPTLVGIGTLAQRRVGPLTEVQRMEAVVALMASCKSIYKLCFPRVRFLNEHAIVTALSGDHLYYTPKTACFQLASNGTFSMWTRSPKPTPNVGNWSLQNYPGKGVTIKFTFVNTKKLDVFKPVLYRESLPFNTEQRCPVSNLTMILRDLSTPIVRRCGAPETLDGPCCVEFIQEIVHELWDSTHATEIVSKKQGEIIKHDIVHAIAPKCTEEGMTDLELRVSIAQAISQKMLSVVH